MIRVLSLLFGYIFGIFQTAYFIGKLRGVDIRTKGSGNVGTTNSFRVFGAISGIATLVLDMLKTVIAVALGLFIIDKLGYLQQGNVLLFTFYIGFGVIAGHNFPFFLKFKGGKGVASTGGLILSTGQPLLFGISAGVFLLFFLTTGYVSVGSIMAYLAFCSSVVIFGITGIYTSDPFLLDSKYLIEIYIIAILIALIGIIKHRSNIQRLIAGNENRFNIWKRRK